MNSKIKQGECPRCEAKEIYQTANGIGGMELSFIKRSKWVLKLHQWKRIYARIVGILKTTSPIKNILIRLLN